jgi:hypothetical protein
VAICKRNKIPDRCQQAFAYVLNRLAGKSSDYMKGSQFMYARALFQSNAGDELEKLIAQRTKGASTTEGVGRGARQRARQALSNQQADDRAIAMLDKLGWAVGDSYTPERQLLRQVYFVQPIDPKHEGNFVLVVNGILKANKASGFPIDRVAAAAEAAQYAAEGDPIDGLRALLTVKAVQADYNFTRAKSMAPMAARAYHILKAIGKLPQGFDSVQFHKDAGVAKDLWRRTPDHPKFGQFEESTTESDSPPPVSTDNTNRIATFLKGKVRNHWMAAGWIRSAMVSNTGAYVVGRMDNMKAKGDIAPGDAPFEFTADVVLFTGDDYEKKVTRRFVFTKDNKPGGKYRGEFVNESGMDADVQTDRELLAQIEKDTAYVAKIRANAIQDADTKPSDYVLALLRLLTANVSAGAGVAWLRGLGWNAKAALLAYKASARMSKAAFDAVKKQHPGE